MSMFMSIVNTAAKAVIHGHMKAIENQQANQHRVFTPERAAEIRQEFREKFSPNQITAIGNLFTTGQCDTDCNWELSDLSQAEIDHLVDNQIIAVISASFGTHTQYALTAVGSTLCRLCIKMENL